MKRRDLVVAGACGVGAALFAVSAPRWLWGSGHDISGAADGRLSHPLLRARLEVRWRLGRLVATLTAKNTSSTEPALVFEPNLPADGDLQNNVFESRSPKGPMEYTGIYIKRPAPRRGDFAEIPPSGELETEIDLTSFYDVPRLTTVTLWYEAFHDPPDSDGLWLIQSNKVVIDT